MIRKDAFRFLAVMVIGLILEWVCVVIGLQPMGHQTYITIAGMVTVLGAVRDGQA